jgi:hypothetical protein
MTSFGTTALGVECHDCAVADESDDRPAEREVLTNLPRTRPARRSTRRATAAPKPDPEPAAPPKPARRAPAKRAAPAKPAAAKSGTTAKRSPAKPATGRRTPPKVVAAPPVDAPAAKARVEAAASATTAQPAPPLPLSHDAHRSPATDLAVATIEFTGELMRIGMDLTRSIMKATLGRVPRP